jgi:hypothetical protein
VRNPDRGKFALESIPEGDYTMTVRFPGLVDRDVDVSAAAGKENDVGTIVLEEGAEIWGVVRRASGRDLPSVVRVVLARKLDAPGGGVSWETVGRAVVQSDGVYRMRGLPTGNFYIQPTTPGATLGTSDPEPISISSPSDVVQNDIVMYGEGYLDIICFDVVDGSRKRVVIPPSYAIRKSDGKETRWWGNRTPLRPGAYELQMELAGGDGVPKRYSVRPFTVQEDETTGPIEVSLHEIRDAE